MAGILHAFARALALFLALCFVAPLAAPPTKRSRSIASSGFPARAALFRALTRFGNRTRCRCAGRRQRHAPRRLDPSDVQDSRDSRRRLEHAAQSATHRRHDLPERQDGGRFAARLRAASRSLAPPASDQSAQRLHAEHQRRADLHVVRSGRAWYRADRCRPDRRAAAALRQPVFRQPYAALDIAVADGAARNGLRRAVAAPAFGKSVRPAGADVGVLGAALAGSRVRVDAGRRALLGTRRVLSGHCRIHGRRDDHDVAAGRPSSGARRAGTDGPRRDGARAFICSPAIRSTSPPVRCGRR